MNKLASLFLEYFFEKVLDFGVDKLLGKKNPNDICLFIEESYRMLCEEHGLEYDLDSIHKTLDLCDFSLDDFENESKLNEILSLILGKDYTNKYNFDIVGEWEKCIEKCLMNPDYSNILLGKNYKVIKKLVSTNDIKSIHYSDTSNIDEFVEAEKLVEIGKYEEAISKFKKLLVYLDDRDLNYKVLFNIASCYFYVDEKDCYKQCVEYFHRAERILNEEIDDVVWLYRNLALAYTHLGACTNKVDNYKKAEVYFLKELDKISNKDDILVADILINLSSIYQDLLNDVPLDSRFIYLYRSQRLLSYVFEHNYNVTNELYFIAVYTYARNYLKMAELISDEFVDYACELLEQILKDDYVKQDKFSRALVYVTLGSAYIHKYIDNDKINESIIFYSKAIEIYKESPLKYYNKILEGQLALADAFIRKFQIFKNKDDLYKANDLLLIVSNKLSNDLSNSILLRTYITQLRMYKVALAYNVDIDIDYDKVLEEIGFINKSINNEKYGLFAKIYSCEIDLVLEKPIDRLKNNYDYLNSILPKLNEFDNTYKYTKEILKLYKEIFE